MYLVKEGWTVILLKELLTNLCFSHSMVYFNFCKDVSCFDDYQNTWSSHYQISISWEFGMESEYQKEKKKGKWILAESLLKTRCRWAGGAFNIRREEMSLADSYSRTDLHIYIWTKILYKYLHSK